MFGREVNRKDKILTLVVLALKIHPEYFKWGQCYEEIQRGGGLAEGGGSRAGPLRHSIWGESPSDPLLETKPGCGGRGRCVKVRVERTAGAKAERWGQSRGCDAGTSRPSVAAEQGESAEWRWAGVGVRATTVLVRRQVCSPWERNGLNPSFSTHCTEVSTFSLTGNLRQGGSTHDV